MTTPADIKQDIASIVRRPPALTQNDVLPSIKNRAGGWNLLWRVLGKISYLLENTGISEAARVMLVSSTGALDYSSVGEAVAAAAALDPPPSASAPVVIWLYPGVILEENPVVIPEWVFIRSVGSFSDTFLQALDPTQPLLDMAPNTAGSGFTVQGAYDVGGIGIRFQGGPGSYALQLVRSLHCETGVHAEGANVFGYVAQCVFGRQPGLSMTTAVRSRGGADLVVPDVAILGHPSARIPFAFDNRDAGSELIISGGLSNYADTFSYTDDGACLGLWSSVVRNADVALHLGPGGAQRWHLVATEVCESLNLDILVEDAASEVRILGGGYDREKVSLPLNANVVGQYVSEEEGDAGVIVLGQQSVGTPDNPAELAVGGGDSTTIGMNVFRNTNGEAGTWSDETEAAKSASGSTFDLFPGLTPNNAAYFGADFPFPNLKIKVDTAIVLGGGSIRWEYYDGVTGWTEVPTMSSDADFPYLQHNDESFERVQSDQVRFGIPSTGTWILHTLDGVQKYWIRCIVVVAITSAPVIERVKIGPNRSEVNLDGFQEYFGRGEPRRDIGMHQRLTDDGTTYSPSNANIVPSPNISISLVDNSFNNGARDGFCYVYQVPNGLDTSRPIEVELSWCPSTGGSGAVELELYVTRKRPGENYLDGSGVETTQQKIILLPGGEQGVGRVTSFEILIPDLDVGEELFFQIERDATGGNPDDTYSGNVVVIALRGFAIFWH